ncbi:accessory gene regulator ArgB-like protein [Brevibacillus laterosporus]|uniref:Accessory gene regulator B family protein n=1 Tax=Brevibacillus laterosporus TaxID=1465 RepID=A0AAP3G815_BRELA|nr:accessory gene regulator B family protein [Brevibacillus laterosporus]MCR8980943.1 accessory gene regulator B family protein [Brevibacillus laterosporus]MCZ0808098.1 accessory gene regulator B family protein [Brevibacillus laterosporus]MCZ0826290.1 accessory gene regulator B family protein [Brevibacillus laterosporus]MCZ0850173.1 accessory gene regulator B family protein [Brevibacillus laterosporus]
MVEKVSKKLAILIYEANPQSSVSVLNYSISVTLNFLAIMIFSILTGYFLGRLSETMTALFSFVILRSFSGGYHLKSLDGCVVATVAIMAFIPYVPMIKLTTVALNVVSATLVMLLAPNNVFDEVKVSKEKYPLLKSISFIIVCTNFVFLSPIIALSFFVQSLLLIPKRR